MISSKQWKNRLWGASLSVCCKQTLEYCIVSLGVRASRSLEIELVLGWWSELSTLSALNWSCCITLENEWLQTKRIFELRYRHKGNFQVSTISRTNICMNSLMNPNQTPKFVFFKTFHVMQKLARTFSPSRSGKTQLDSCGWSRSSRKMQTPVQI